MPVLCQRLEQRTARGDDPSEADTTVLERLIAVDQPLNDQERIAAPVVDVARPVAAAVLVRRWLGAESISPRV